MYEPLATAGPEASEKESYLDAYKLLCQENSGALESFATLHERYPQDTLVEFHYKRLKSGILEHLITLTEK